MFHILLTGIIAIISVIVKKMFSVEVCQLVFLVLRQTFDNTPEKC